MDSLEVQRRNCIAKGFQRFLALQFFTVFFSLYRSCALRAISAADFTVCIGATIEGYCRKTTFECEKTGMVLK